MKTQWNLGSFSLDTGGLWNSQGGPRWQKENEARLEKAHRALREQFTSGAIGFYDWPNRITSEEVQAMQSLAERLRKEYDGAAIIGIGGSYLGPAALYQALRAPEAQEKFPVTWVSNVDPAAMEQARYFVGKHKAATVVISKSGGTTETLSAFFHLSRHLDPKGYVLITDPKAGELRRLAQKYDWASFSVPPNIGGRYSVLTPVGLFPAFLGGLPVDEILRGAREMHDYLDSCSPAENPAYLLACAKEAWDVGHHHSIQYLMPYTSGLKLFADWYVQLWGESIGKKQRTAPNRAVGFTPVAALGTSDQHSLLQLFKEGPNNKIIGFVDVLSEGGKTVIGEPGFEVKGLNYLFQHTFEEITHLACGATQKSLSNSGVPTYRLSIPRLDARFLGALFLFFETACAFAGELYDVDAFNQPGVEEAKKLLRAAL